MLAKREGRAKSNLLFIVLFAGLFVLVSLFESSFVSAQTGMECASSPTLGHCGGASIYSPGYGAVELCQVCYKCGISGPSDGVCPESYSDGINETNPEKLTMMMRVSRDITEGDVYSVAFQTGTLACASIGGVCNYVQRSTDSATWVNLSGECARDVSNIADAYNNAYFRVVCRSVPRKAGCEYCPDPDCGTIISGKMFDTVSDAPLSAVSIAVTSSNNSNYDFSGGPFGGGVYEMSVATGYVNFTCSKSGYDQYSTMVYLKNGRNIVDCAMTPVGGSCNPQCYVTDTYGNAVCNALCIGQNGCNMTPEAIARCDGLLLGTQIVLNSTTITDPINGCIYGNVTTLTCCNGGITSTITDYFGEGGCPGCEMGNYSCVPIVPGGGLFTDGNLTNKLTRNYRVIWKGLPVTLKIITYN
jgi:hypothetical protein